MNTYKNIEIGDMNALILEGRLKKYSTEKLHVHKAHQILSFKSGISLLLDEHKKQPLYHKMTAFIPAGCPHRSIVLGKEVVYKSLYINTRLFKTPISKIRIFDISELGQALLNRLNFARHPSRFCDSNDLTMDCLELFLKVIEVDIKKRSSISRLPLISNPQNQPLIDYIEDHFDEKIRLKDFSDLMNYTERHLSRIFKQDLKISIFEYLKLFRMMKASLKLETSHKTITEIAYDCGYDSISCFYKDFSQIFSVTPKQFKKRITGIGV